MLKHTPEPWGYAIVPLKRAEIEAEDLCILVEHGGFIPNTSEMMNSRAAKPYVGDGDVILLLDINAKAVPGLLEVVEKAYRFVLSQSSAPDDEADILSLDLAAAIHKAKKL